MTDPLPRSAGAERSRLSVCCLAAGNGRRAAAALSPLRAVADEIVVALDDRAAREDALLLAGLADVVVPYPYAEPVDRPLPWLVARCSGDWVLIVDDDEVPSLALVEAMPRLLAARDVTHYWLSRRWLYPDKSRWLAEPPWFPDFQLRLLVSDARLVRFPDETHRPIEVVGPCRFLDLPLYHADCLLKTPEDRLAKARKYERLRPGKRVAGGPMNHLYHLPERRASPRLEPVAEEDRTFIDALLSGQQLSVGPGGTVEPPSTRHEIDRRWPGRTLREADYRARLELLEPLATMAAGERRAVLVRAENQGGDVWPWGLDAHPEITLSYHWLDPSGVVVVPDGVRTPFPADVRPEEVALVPMHVVAPDAPGSYRLAIDLVHERVRWFECSVTVDVTIEPRRQVAVAGDAETVERTLERLNEEEPELEPIAVERPDRPPPRFGPPRAPDLHEYLFDGAPTFRPLWGPVLLARTGRLLRAARRRRRGRPSAPLPNGASELLGALERCRTLVLVGTMDTGTWALWERASLALAARMLGIRIELGEAALPPPAGPLDAALVRLVRRLAS